MLTRWLTVFLVAIGVGVAALELAAPPALESPAPWSAVAGPLFTDAGGPGLPTGAEMDSTEVSALPRFTE